MTLDAEPARKIVFLGLAQLTARIGIVSLRKSFDGGHELPHGHSVYLLRCEAHNGARAVDGGESELSVREAI